jgi:tetratricopeptide (TPR) repeat protein
MKPQEPRLNQENQPLEQHSDLLMDADWLDSQLLQAIEFHQSGQIGEAENLYNEIILKHPNQPNANHNKGLILVETNDVDASLFFFRVALEEEPEEHMYWTSYIDALIKVGQYNEANLVMSYGVYSGLDGEKLNALKVQLSEIGFELETTQSSLSMVPDLNAEKLNELNIHLESLKSKLLIMAPKRTSLLENKNEITAIAVGSSHGDDCFNPKYSPGSFNLCSSSQDLKHSSYLYERVCELCPNINTLIVFYSIFSPGSILEKSPSEKAWCVVLNELFNLNIEYDDEVLNELSNIVRGKLDDVATAVEDGICGFTPSLGRYFFPDSYGADKRANDHMRFNATTSANIYLIKMILFARSLNHKVIIVIPPVRSDYFNAIGKNSRHLFKSVHEITKFKTDCKIQILDFYGSDLFKDHHFGDFDHLLPLGEGTEIISSKIYDTLSSNI